MITKNLGAEVAKIRNKRLQRERDKYLNLFLSKIKINGVDDFWIEDYIKRELYYEGQVAIFGKIAGSIVGAAPFAPNLWGYANKIMSVMLINKRGVPVIPQGIQVVDKDAVLVYLQPNRKSIVEMIDSLIVDVVNIDMIIDVALFNCKLPAIIGVDITDQNAVDNVMKKLIADEPVILTKLRDINSMKAVNNAGNYIVDKLQAQKALKEAEILTYFGFENVAYEKKERLLVDEVNANNEFTNQHKQIFIDSINGCLEKANELFGYNLEAEINEPKLDIEAVNYDEHSEMVESHEEEANDESDNI